MLNGLFCFKTILFSLLLMTATVSVHARMPTLDAGDQSALSNMVPLDARPIERCLEASVTGARCLPVDTFYSKHQQLASFYHINWVFGTAGLEDDDVVLVFAERAIDRDALAGLLFLAGHLKVFRWAGSFEELQQLLGKEAGQSRGITRTHIYKGTTRDEFIAQAGDLPALVNAGWTLSTTPRSEKNVTGGVIVVAGSPVKAVAEFTDLLADERLPLMVVIDTGVVN